MVDVDGREYLDYHAAFGPIILGHNHSAVNRSVTEAITAVDMVGVGITELEVHLAQKLCRISLQRKSIALRHRLRSEL